VGASDHRCPLSIEASRHRRATVGDQKRKEGTSRKMAIMGGTDHWADWRFNRTFLSYEKMMETPLVPHAEHLMSLEPIPADPEPMEEEIAAELANQEARFQVLPQEMRRRFAEMSWRLQKEHDDPNAFWQPFAPENHAVYLDSPLWRRIRRKVLREANDTCLCCGGKATQVHHRCYRPRVLSGQDTSLLIAVCVECHQKIDRDENCKVRDSRSKERVLATLYEANASNTRRGR
jgi:hypothetical protein